MHRDLHFPTPIYVADIKHPTLNQELERDIVAWSKQDKGIVRTNANLASSKSIWYLVALYSSSSSSSSSSEKILHQNGLISSSSLNTAGSIEKLLLIGLGTMQHELEVAAKAGMLGSIDNYYDVYSNLRPSIKIRLL